MKLQPNIAVECLSLLLRRFQEVPCSKLGQDTSYLE